MPRFVALASNSDIRIAVLAEAFRAQFLAVRVQAQLDGDAVDHGGNVASSIHRRRSDVTFAPRLLQDVERFVDRIPKLCRGIRTAP
jgi:hypothetical protein